MNSSRNKDLLWAMYNDSRTVFTLADVAMLTGDTEFESINQKLNYQVRQNRLLNPRKGIYAKHGYNPGELVCTLYTPSYLSLEYVLQEAGVIFQYDSRMTAVSYLSRNLEVDGFSLVYRKIKNEVLVNTSGIIRKNNRNIATPERAVLDMLYLNGSYFFDNLQPLNKQNLRGLLPVYGSKILTARVNKMLQDGTYKQA